MSKSELELLARAFREVADGANPIQQQLAQFQKSGFVNSPSYATEDLERRRTLCDVLYAISAAYTKAAESL
jgi:hypothetical protein